MLNFGNMATHEIKRSIKWHGKEFLFYRHDKDEYQSETQDSKVVCMLHGIFYRQGYSHRTLSKDNKGTKEAEYSADLVTLYESARMIQEGDEVIIDSIKFRVTAITNINLENVISVISLDEVINHGATGLSD